MMPSQKALDEMESNAEKSREEQEKQIACTALLMNAPADLQEAVIIRHARYIFDQAFEAGRQSILKSAVEIEGIPLPPDDLCSNCDHFHTPEWNMICCVITCQCDSKTFVSAAAVKPTELSITIDDLPEPDFSLISNPIPDNAQIEAMMDQEYEANPYR